MTDSPSIGPPPAGPLMCFPCATGTCGHRRKFSEAHGGGLVPALTTLDGTALCLDCACDAARPESAVTSATAYPAVGGGGGGYEAGGQSISGRVGGGGLSASAADWGGSATGGPGGGGRG